MTLRTVLGLVVCLLGASVQADSYFPLRDFRKVVIRLLREQAELEGASDFKGLISECLGRLGPDAKLAVPLLVRLEKEAAAELDLNQAN